MPTIEAESGAAVASTERLTLSRLARSDASAIAAMSNDLAVLRSLSFLPYPLTAGAVEVWVDGQPDTHEWFVASLTGEEQIIGAAGIHPDDKGGAEIGYWLGRAYWGCGYATEISEAVAAIARGRGHDPIWASVLPDNAGSIRVLQKTGFVRDGEARRVYRLRNSEMTVHRYRLGGKAP